MAKFRIEVLVKAGYELYVGVVSPNTCVPKALHSELPDRDIVVVVLDGIPVSPQPFLSFVGLDTELLPDPVEPDLNTLPKSCLFSDRELLLVPLKCRTTQEQPHVLAQHIVSEPVGPHNIIHSVYPEIDVSVAELLLVVKDGIGAERLLTSVGPEHSYVLDLP